MRLRLPTLLAVLALIPAYAAEVPFSGRTLEISGDQGDGSIDRMLGAQYNIPGTGADIIGRAQTCAAGVGGLTVESADPSAGTLVLRASTEFRSGFTTRTIRSRIDLGAADASFQITESEIAVREGAGDANAFGPLTRASGGWEKGLEALIGLENKLVDCLYR